MICKWCGANTPDSKSKCVRCGRPLPPKSDCGGFYDLVPEAKKIIAGRSNPVPAGSPAYVPAAAPKKRSPVLVLSLIIALAAAVIMMFFFMGKAGKLQKELDELEEEQAALAPQSQQDFVVPDIVNVDLTGAKAGEKNSLTDTESGITYGSLAFKARSIILGWSADYVVGTPTYRLEYRVAAETPETPDTPSQDNPLALPGQAEPVWTAVDITPTNNGFRYEKGAIPENAELRIIATCQSKDEKTFTVIITGLTV